MTDRLQEIISHFDSIPFGRPTLMEQRVDKALARLTAAGVINMTKSTVADKQIAEEQRRIAELDSLRQKLRAAGVEIPDLAYAEVLAKIRQPRKQLTEAELDWIEKNMGISKESLKKHASNS